MTGYGRTESSAPTKRKRIVTSGCTLLTMTETRETPSVMAYGHAASLNEGGEARFARATPHQSRFPSMGGDWHFAPKGRGAGMGL